MKIKILLVEDHTLIRSSFRLLLERQTDIQIVGETNNGLEAIELANQISPDVIIMDVVLRGSEISGIQATRRITAMKRNIKVIGLSVMEELAYVKSMLSAGASGYLSKGCSEDELLEAIHTVLKDQIYFSKEAERVIREDYVKIIQSPYHKGELTDRELEVLRLTALGENSKEIAARFNISRKTVDTHKRKIMEKLNLWNIADLTKYALKEGIIQEDE